MLAKGGIWPPTVPLSPLWSAQGSHPGTDFLAAALSVEISLWGPGGKPSAPAAQTALESVPAFLFLSPSCPAQLLGELGAHTASTGMSSAHFSWAQLRFHWQHLFPLGQEHTGTPLRGYPSLCVPLCTPHLWLKDRSANLGVLTEVTK